ncbi:MAG: HAD family hydrolase [Acidimicrobiales bacterium]
MIRLVVTDLDGTFWDHDLTVPEAHLNAVDELQRRGIEVIVATSRRRRVVEHHMGRVGRSFAAVVLDGAMGVDLRNGTRFHDAPFAADAAVEVLKRFRLHGFEPCVYVDESDVDVVLPTMPSTCRAHADYLAPIARTGDLDLEVASGPVYGFSVVGRPREDLARLATELTNDGAELMLFPERTYGGWGLVVAPPSVTKWSGVLAYCEPRGIQPREVMAVGDGDNDIDMLRRCGVAVAVRGGTEGAVAVADDLIEPPEARGWAAVVDIVDGAGG